MEMEKEVKKSAKKDERRSLIQLPPKRGQIKARIFEDFVEALKKNLVGGEGDGSTGCITQSNYAADTKSKKSNSSK
ncbi:unnamed protein product [Linum trigynum]|uniref:Uncharacterized protein n=1 Tax=Linum trigynum TaxID=586398 RepID=A0AAV2DKG8_9ROSI